MKLHLLGVCGPFPPSRGATSGYLLEAGENLFQFDLGSGVLGQLTALAAPESLTALFISHWHFDHTADLPVLLYRLESMKKTLPVYGPADPSSPLLPLIASSPWFTFTEVLPGQCLEFPGATVRVTAARHPVPTVGWRVACGGKDFGYTGDTNTLPSLVQDFRGCTVLLADALFADENWAENKPHLSARLAAQLAEDAGAGRLVLTHHNPFLPLAPRLQEAREAHADIVPAEAGMTIDI
jgi:ribonuclease BN (tRNA processing enzyme)